MIKFGFLSCCSLYSEYIEEDDEDEDIPDEGGAGDDAGAGDVAEAGEDDNTGDFDFAEEGFGTGPIGRGGTNSLENK